MASAKDTLVGVLMHTTVSTIGVASLKRELPYLTDQTIVHNLTYV